MRSLELALWALHHSESFSERALQAVKLGDDADTGAITGMIFGLINYPELLGVHAEIKVRYTLNDRPINTDHLFPVKTFLNDWCKWEN